MSFSKSVKEELFSHIGSAKHCQIAELAAIMNLCGQYGQDENGNFTLGFVTENESVVRKGFTLLKKTFNINTDSVISESMLCEFLSKIGDLNKPVPNHVLSKTCCKRAFLRGAFCCIGSISDPGKGYHLELAANDVEKAKHLKNLMADFGIEAKIIARKRYFVVYVKEGEGIVDFLNVCEAPIALMELENMRILKEMRNSVNRRVNCETANIAKTVNAASRQIEDIIFLRDVIGLENLPLQLKEMAEVRLENPDAPLKDLGALLDPPVGKSGVNHRLRKLSELASQSRDEK